jgi:hypothetical protein
MNWVLDREEPQRNRPSPKLSAADGRVRLGPLLPVPENVVPLSPRFSNTGPESGGSPLLQQGGAGLQSSGKAIHSERTGFSPGFSRPALKAHHRSATLFRNAEALLPSLKQSFLTNSGLTLGSQADSPART